ncbi:HotDog domain-containing protein [Tricharina praecox]|uniref:HotDog domain-containing protein n=1 Tax=Tricharina praecox TaxID=43433 RepID=UPI00221EE9B2|nr:HotDog domain-containing protein [Tricharina praecox]KAI5846208.1 HotDog domain-containing protein [Tricharina praecox]
MFRPPLLAALRGAPRRHSSTLAARPAAPLRPLRVLLAATSIGLLTFTFGAATLKSILPGTGPIDGSPLHSHDSPFNLPSLTTGASVLARNATYQRLLASDEWTLIPDVAESLPLHVRATKLMSGALRGHRKITANVRFVHKDGLRAVSLLRLGNALCGHPNVVHGGVLATVADEALGRLAIAQFPDGGGVTARLVVNYRAPARAVDDVFVWDGVKVLEAEVVEVGERKVTVRGILKDEEGKTLLNTEALFVVPKGWRPRPLVEH